MENTKMKMIFDKPKTASTALILMLTFSATILALPIVSAHDPPINIKTYAFLSLAPTPAAVNQPVFVYMWLSFFPPTAVGQWGDRWHDFKVEITSPSGNQETLGPFTSDPVGIAYSTYIPNEVGTYTFVFSFPGETLAGDDPPPSGARGQIYIGDYFEPSSAEQTLTVLEDPIETWQEPPLPTDYWYRPIDAQNREWYRIAGNWLMGRGQPYDTIDYDYNSFNPYTAAPNTAHIVWTKELTFGGVVGGQWSI
jgi:hypothetical protein